MKTANNEIYEEYQPITSEEMKPGGEPKAKRKIWKLKLMIMAKASGGGETGVKPMKRIINVMANGET